MSISSIQAGRIICELSGWKASNLKLQKLLYIACLNFIGEDKENPKYLIRGDFEAWKYGPLQPELYDFCKDFGASHVKNVFPYVDIRKYHQSEYGMLKTVVNWGRDKSPGYLVGYTHKEGGAWERTKNEFGEKSVIPYRYIQEEYIREKRNDEKAR